MDGKDQVLDTAGGLLKRVIDQETELNQAHERERLAEHGETVFEKRWILEREITSKLIFALKELLYQTERKGDANHFMAVHKAEFVIAEAEAHLKETP